MYFAHFLMDKVKPRDDLCVTLKRGNVEFSCKSDVFRKLDLLQGAKLRVEVLESSNQLPLFAELVLLDAQGGVELLHQVLDIVQPLCLLVRQQL